MAPRVPISKDGIVTTKGVKLPQPNPVYLEHIRRVMYITAPIKGYLSFALDL